MLSDVGLLNVPLPVTASVVPVPSVSGPVPRLAGDDTLSVPPITLVPPL